MSPKKLLNFSFNVDPDPNPNPASHPIADPDIASQKDPQSLLKVGFAILFYATYFWRIICYMYTFLINKGYITKV